jgi:hypothetical protein
VLASVRTDVVRQIRQTLVHAANPAGGWGYYASKRSRIEPTCWALLALAEAADQEPGEWNAFAAPHLAFLTACRRADGLLVENGQSPPNFTTNGFAATALQHFPSWRPNPVATRLLEGIAAIKGVGVKTANPRQNDLLQGWPWTPETFSWVEPTSWCVMALKRARSDVHNDAAEARIREAETLLLNRICTSGGWNFGNANAFGQDLRPYVPTTAIGLMAVQNARNDPAVQRTVAYLDRARFSEPSAMALGLTAVALRLYGRPVEDVEERLAADTERAERIGNLQSLAIALYALSADHHGVRAFHV